LFFLSQPYMPRKGKKGRAPRSSNAGVLSRVSFKFFSVVALSAGTSTLPLRPDQFGTAISSVSDGFDLFRVVSFRMKIVDGTAPCAAAVIGSVPNTLPSTRTTICEIIDSCVHGGPTMTVPAGFTVRPATLNGPLPWYHTRAGTYDVTESVPATIVFGGGASDNVSVWYSGTFEFKDPIPTSSTPLALECRIRLRDERERIAHEQARLAILRALVPYVASSNGTPGARSSSISSDALTALCSLSAK